MADRRSGRPLVDESDPASETFLCLHPVIRLSSRDGQERGNWADFSGEMRHPHNSRACTPARRTTALRCPWNYGLRGWILTHSNKLARVPQGAPEGHLFQG